MTGSSGPKLDSPFPKGYYMEMGTLYEFGAAGFSTNPREEFDFVEPWLYEPWSGVGTEDLPGEMGV